MSLFDDFFEPYEAERARLAAAPVGSLNHGLSLLPVTISQWPEALTILLPNLPNADGSMPHRDLVVVPYQYVPSGRELDDTEAHRRFDGSWSCLVVYAAGPDNTYRVGQRLSISAAELSRGALVDLTNAVVTACAARTEQTRTGPSCPDAASPSTNAHREV